MLKTSKIAVFFLFTTILASTAAAGGTYDGIWTEDAAIVTEYFTLQQNGSTIIVADLDSSKKTWDAYQGSIDANNKITINMILSMLYPGAKATVTLEFSSSTKGTLTLVSCTPPPNSNIHCNSTPGAQTQIKRIF
ncbi:MAG TPA: hypothetical protein VMH83_08330 [Candidatus Acidoferrum sp.]|nr:hypothetical protein [Candidatus Acidoferrum sp.]